MSFEVWVAMRIKPWQSRRLWRDRTKVETPNEVWDMLVYYVSDGTYVKIGVTVGLKARLVDLQSANPRRLICVRVEPGSTMREQALHRRFAHLRVRGEWFLADAELAWAAFDPERPPLGITDALAVPVVLDGLDDLEAQVRDV